MIATQSKQQTHTHAYTCNGCQTSHSLHAVVEAGFSDAMLMCPTCKMPMEDYTLHRHVWPKPAFLSSGDVVADCVRLLREWDAAAPTLAGEWMDSHVLQWWWCVNHRQGFTIEHQGNNQELPLDGIVVWHQSDAMPCLVLFADGEVMYDQKRGLEGLRDVLAFSQGYAPIA